MSRKYKLNRREKIKLRIRKKIIGTPQRPRLLVFRSQKHIYAHLVDDINNITITTVSSLSKQVRELLKDNLNKTEQSKIVGKFVARKAFDLNVKEVVFDRNGYLYHGRVKALANQARDEGLKF